MLPTPADDGKQHLKDMEDYLASLSQEELDKIKAEALLVKEARRFIPNPGPQTQAYFSLADVTLFGGNPGGGKSALEIGLALNEHHRSLILRRNFSDLGGLLDTAKKLVGSARGFIGGNRPEYRKEDGGVIHFAGLPEDGGVGGHQGVDHDLICIDEAATVSEDQIRLVMGWLRTDLPGQRCRVVLGSNPPLDSTGDWMVDYFAPWLDPKHSNPALPGELRYFLRDDDGREREVNKDEFLIRDGVVVRPQSRTFIPSKFTDNPFYKAEEYAKQMESLPDHVREILSTGNFMLSRKDRLDQLIPTQWVREAMRRWQVRAPAESMMSAIGVDVAQGGEDNTVLACRNDYWYAPFIIEPGKKTPTGAEVAALVIRYRTHNADVILDMGGGYGGAPWEHLKTNGISAIRYKGNNSSYAKSRDGCYKFTNKRAEAYWRLREALDPGQPGGSQIQLPDDKYLLTELTAVHYKSDIKTGITVEAKDEVKKRIRRSPDRADAVVMAWNDGKRPDGQPPTPISRGRTFTSGKVPKVNLGHDKQRRGR